uniref:Probable RNA polymerase II nuclear localization protein SLC7A6OS n=1 Tax=Bursaphelenchus xylophilus TaxID=6326 RepID=A0A1I7RQY7_BURXY
MDSLADGPTSRIIRVRRKRSANPHSGLLVSDSFDGTAGPSKRAKSDFDLDQTTAFRLIGTLPLPDVRDAARLFLNTNVPKRVELVDFDGTTDVPVQSAAVVPVEVDDVSQMLDESVKKVNQIDLNAPLDPYLAIPDEAPLARPESGLDEDYVYDFYHTEDYVPRGDASMVNVRLPTDEELQLYFGHEDDGESEDADDDSNAENYYANDYPDEEELDKSLENDETSSDDSYDHYGDEKDYDACYREEKLSSDEDGSIVSGMAE